ncbi:unnamed protein product, partial [Prorocentrum cordatum]
ALPIWLKNQRGASRSRSGTPRSNDGGNSVSVARGGAWSRYQSCRRCEWEPLGRARLGLLLRLEESCTTRNEPLSAMAPRRLAAARLAQALAATARSSSPAPCWTWRPRPSLAQQPLVARPPRRCSRPSGRAAACGEAAAATAAEPSSEDAFRRASGVCKDLHRRHRSAVEQVPRCRRAPGTAEAREQRLRSRRPPAPALLPPSAAGPSAGSAADLVQLSWGDSAFEDEGAEELDELQSHSTGVRATLEQAKTLAEQSRQRAANKCKGPAGPAAPGAAAAESAAGPAQATPAAAQPAAPSMAATTAASTTPPQREAAKLSQAKVRAAEQATAAASAAVKTKGQDAAAAA